MQTTSTRLWGVFHEDSFPTASDKFLGVDENMLNWPRVTSLT